MDEVMTVADATSSGSQFTSPPSSPASLLPVNIPLLSAFLACAIAQFLKLFTTWYKEKRWDSKRMLDSGGMPSSHSATVMALVVAVGLQDGTGGPTFAIAVVLACVVMYDATGVRLHAGRQAELLNQIVCEFPPEHPLSTARPLRDSLGHTPFQKINQKNTWELTLIDHLFDIIKVDEENDVETNFQKASCTLEAGVKIYSMRVDSVHSEAYKVLGGINRVGQENEEDGTVEDSNVSGGQEEGNSKKEKDRKWSPLSTLESSFEALNVKKFDAAFAVDPLYHQTSAQFDEGGAKGLLLNNLGVYGGCRVLFDSLEVPGKCSSCSIQHDKAETIDISFARECSEHMVFNMPKMGEISPSLMDIVNHFDDDNKRPADAFSSGTKPAEQIDEAYSNDTEFNGDAFDNGGAWDLDHDDQTSVVDEGTYGVDPILPSLYEENEPVNFHDPDMDDRFAEVDGYLFLSLGFTSKLNAWAGPDHWKYRKSKGSEDVVKEHGSPVTTKKPKNKKQAAVDIDFTKALDKDLSDVFALPKNPKSLLLPTNREPCNTTLPEDCHYQPENLVKLFLLPNVMCLGRRGRKSSVTPSQQRDDNGPLPSWNDETVFGDQFDDGNGFSDVEEFNTLVSQPRQVNKIEVQYDRTSKQVDVQSLKETLWESLQESQLNSVQAQGETISFKHALASFPNNCRAAASLEDISPHLCFICLLHLANEHGLSIHGCANLEDLSIHLPASQ